MGKRLTYFMQAITIIVFASLIPILFFVDKSTYLVWTVVIPFVPVLIIAIGYSNWRNICPLAFFSKISQKINLKQKKKVPQWFEENFYLFQFSLLFVAFAARLVLLNYDAVFLALFFIFVVTAAFAINWIYAGKSWCNFFCPVGVVEKIYCGSNAHNYNHSSACSQCSACKKNCPDIDMESNYWKESANSQKTVVFYSFAGLVLGFYLYFYLQTGSFSYYFKGEWSLEYTSILSPGFFFAPFIPLILAAPITLALFSALSYYLFKLLENYMWKKKIFKDISYSTLTHRVKAISAFIAFNIFYAFAGAPAYLHYPMFYAFFHFFVVVASALVLHREIFREESYFIQERFALKMIKAWDSDKPIPTNLKEIYYTYKNQKQDKDEQLKTYKESISDLLQDGILNQHSMIILEKLREQMGISQKDHYNVIREIQLKDTDLFDDNIEQSAERRYQKKSYKSMIETALKEHKQLDQAIIDSIQEQFCISNDVHKTIMNEIMHSNSKLKADVLSLIESMQSLAEIHTTFVDDCTREVIFLKYSIREQFNRLSKDLFVLLDIIYEDFNSHLTLFKKILRYNEIDVVVTCDGSMLSFMDEDISKAILELNKALKKETHDFQLDKNFAAITALLKHKSLTLATVALLCMKNYPANSYKDIDYSRFFSSKDDDIIAVADKIKTSSDIITTYDKMAYLHNIPIFSSIIFDELYELAKLTNPLNFSSGENIIVQGDYGDSLFIITSGDVEVVIDNKLVNTLHDGDYFGEIAIIADTKRTATVRSSTECSTLKLSTKAFKELIYDNPKISLKVMKEITNRLLQNSKSS